MRSRDLLAVVLATPLLVGGVAACGTQAPGSSLSDQARHAQASVGHVLYWVGPSLDGLKVTGVVRDSGSTTLVYGSCKVVGEDGGCEPPLEIQTTSICFRNPLKLDVRPSRAFRARGVVVRHYDDNQFELATGASEVVVFARGARAQRAIAQLRPVTARRAVTRLATPRYPIAYIAHLQRVSATYARTRTLSGVRSALGISRSAARFQLTLADELGAARLQQSGGQRSPQAGCELERRPG